MLFWVPVAVVAVSSIQVESTARCLSSGEIQEQLALLRLEPGASRVVVVEEEANLLRVRLIDADQKVLAERMLEPAPSCDARAMAVAVVIASWEGRFRAPAIEPLELPPQRKSPLAATPRPSVDPPEWEPLRLELRAGAVVSPVPFAPGALAAVQLGWGASPWRGEAGLVVLASRELALAEGWGRWQTTSLLLGATRQFHLGELRVDASAHAIGSMLAVSGMGFAVNRDTVAAESAVGLGVAVSRRMGRLRPFLSLEAVTRTGRQVMRVDGFEEGQELPRVELWLSLGMGGQVQ